MKLLFFSLAFLSFFLRPSYAKDIVAVYDLHGILRESGAVEPSPLNLLGDQSRSITHYDLVKSLNHAVADDQVKAIVIDIDDAALENAQLQEVRRLLLDARAQAKDVWLFSQTFSASTALLGSAANHFAITPESGSSFQGIYSESLYFKGLMDKMGVKMDVVHIGDYKSAGEQFYRSKPSEYQQQQTTKLIDSLYLQLINQISTGRAIKQKEVEKLIDRGFLNSNQLLEAKLVDHVEYKTDLIRKIRTAYKGAKFDRSYKLPNTGPPKIDGLMDLLKLFSGKQKTRDLSEPYIAVVSLEGVISDASIAPVRKEILKVTKDTKCKGLVLRVNSPGGSALASEVLWEATDEFKKTKRPFVVSMGGVAASGGYYVSAGADHIFAEEATITGSIGVVGMKPALGTAMEKLGITTFSHKRGKFADIYNTNRGFSAAERELVKTSMLEVYQTFKKRISDGRGKKLKGDLETLAGGRVFTGKDALGLGLVDQLGGLNDAIYFILDQCKDKTLYTHLFPEPQNPMEMLFQSPKQNEQEEFIQTQRPKMSKKLNHLIFNNDLINILGRDKRSQLNTFLQQLEACQEYHIQLIAPIGLQSFLP